MILETRRCSPHFQTCGTSVLNILMRLRIASNKGAGIKTKQNKNRGNRSHKTSFTLSVASFNVNSYTMHQRCVRDNSSADFISKFIDAHPVIGITTHTNQCWSAIERSSGRFSIKRAARLPFSLPDAFRVMRYEHRCRSIVKKSSVMCFAT